MCLRVLCIWISLKIQKIIQVSWCCLTKETLFQLLVHILVRSDLIELTEVEWTFWTMFKLLQQNSRMCAQFCPILCDPMDCRPPDSIHGIPRARILGWVAASFSRGSCQPRDRTQVSWVSCISRWILYFEPLGKPKLTRVIPVLSYLWCFWRIFSGWNITEENHAIFWLTLGKPVF